MGATLASTMRSGQGAQRPVSAKYECPLWLGFLGMFDGVSLRQFKRLVRRWKHEGEDLIAAGLTEIQGRYPDIDLGSYLF